MTTRNTATSTKPENLAGLEFRDEVKTAKEQVSYLDSQGADVIIAITHMGVLKESLCSSEALANAMAGTELDAIIDGHSHTVINEDIGGITIAQTGTGGANVGRMEIDIDENNNVSINETMLSKEFFKNIEPDPDVASVIDSVSAELNKTLMQEIGETEITLWGGGLKNFKDGASIAESRVGETNFGSIISDAMIFDAEDIIPDTYKNSSGEIDIPIVAIENGGGFRASVPNGKSRVAAL